MRRWANILCCTLVLALLAVWAPGCRDVSEERYGKKSENDSEKLERPRRLFPDVTPSPPPSPDAGVEPETEAVETEAPGGAVGAESTGTVDTVTGAEETGGKPASRGEEVAAISAVRETLRSNVSPGRWETGSLKGGIAILADDTAAWWVSPEGRVLAANGTAKMWSEGVEYSPTGIDINSVTAAVRKHD